MNSLKCPSCGIYMTLWEFDHHDCERGYWRIVCG